MRKMYPINEDKDLEQLLRRIMEAEGRQLLPVQKSLNTADCKDIPQELKARGLAAIAQHMTVSDRRKRRSSGRRPARWLLTALLAALFFITAFAAVEEIRTGSRRLVLQEEGDRTSFIITPRISRLLPLADIWPDAHSELVLRGYHLPEALGDLPTASLRLHPLTGILEHTSSHGNTLRITVAETAEELQIDTFGAEPSPVTVNGHPGQLWEHRQTSDTGRSTHDYTLLWVDTQSGHVLCISGENTDAEFLLKLAGQMRPADPSEPLLRWGYRLPSTVQDLVFCDAYHSTVRYESQHGHYLELKADNDMLQSVRTKGYQKQEVLICGQPGHLYEKAVSGVVFQPVRQYTLVWADVDTGMIFCIRSRGVEKDALLQYAESIRYTGT